MLTSIYFRYTQTIIMDIEPTHSAWIEGISNDVIIILVVVIVIAYGWIRTLSGTPNRNIHPTQQEQVSTTRGIVQGPNRRRARQNDGEPCPICLDSVNFTTETTCGHVFCCELY